MTFTGASAVIKASGATSDDAVTASGAESAMEAIAATDVELDDAIKGSLCKFDLAKICINIRDYLSMYLLHMVK